MRRIFIRDLELDASIGLHPDERSARQPVRITVEMTVDDGPIDDADVAGIVDYEGLALRLRSLIEQGHVNLVETLAERIAALCLADRRVRSVLVRVEKPRAIAGARSAGVEIERSRP